MDGLLIVKVSLLLAAAFAVIYSRATATARHRLWTLVFTAVLLLPLLPAVPGLELPVPVPDLARDATPHPGTSPTVAGATLTDASQTSPVIDDWPLPPPATLVAAAAASGTAVALAMVLLSLWRVRRLAADADDLTDPNWCAAAASLAAALQLRHLPRLLISPRVATPMAGGFRRPIVFLPEAARSWTDQCRDIVLAHELAHAAQHDPLRHLLARVTLALYWFHPLAWLAVRHARAAQEQACDETVLSLGTRASSYAHVLLEMAETWSPHRVAALPMAERPFLEHRIMAILNTPSQTSGGAPSHRRRAALYLSAAAIAAVTLTVAAAQPRQASPAAATPSTTQASPVPASPATAPAPADRVRAEANALRASIEELRSQEARLRKEVAELMWQSNAIGLEMAAARAETERAQADRYVAEIADAMKAEALARLNAADVTVFRQAKQQMQEQERQYTQAQREMEREMQRAIQMQDLALQRQIAEQRDGAARTASKEEVDSLRKAVEELARRLERIP